MLMILREGLATPATAPVGTGVVLAADKPAVTGNTEPPTGSAVAPQASGNGGDTQESPSKSGVAPDPAQTGSGDTSTTNSANDGGSSSGSTGTGKFDQTPACDGEARKSDKFRYAGYWYQSVALF